MNFIAISVSFVAAQKATAQTADVAFVSAKVYTINDKQPEAEAVAIKGNKIIFVGSKSGVQKHVGKSTEVLDLTGKTILPGFISAHDHLIASNWTSAGVNLYDAKSKEEALNLIQEYAAANPDHKVIKGIGWSRATFGGELPTAKDLDTAISDRPAIILDYTIHDAWLNTAALAAGNVTKDTPDLLPGTTYWVRDNDGNPTGIAIEIQWMKTYVDIGAWDPGPMMRESTEKLFTLAARNGTTTILNPGVVTPNIKDTHGGMEKDFEAAMEMLEELDKQGQLLLRVQALPIFKSTDADPAKFVAFGKRMSETYKSDRIRVQSLKIHPEGNATAHAAPFLKPYSDKDTMGGFNVKPEVTKQIVSLAAEAGLDVMIHTDGDASSRAAIDAIAAAREAGHKDNRSALHHAIWVHPADQARIIALKIPVNTTPSFSNDFGGQDEEFTKLLGKDRIKTSLGRYAYLARKGVNVSISADVPSTPPSMQAPMFVIEAAVTLKQPSARGKSKTFPPDNKGLTVAQAIRAMTIDAAWQLRMEDKIGSLEVGKYADVVVLDKDPFKVHPLDLSDIDVAMTMMDGRFTYRPDRDMYLSPAEMTGASQ